jgi:septal ring factor EnvC (AmiA/AmiB activator)
MVFLIVFLLGGLAAIYLFYLPERDQLAAAQAQQSETEASLAAANTRISELEAEIARLQSLQVENDRLEAEMLQAELHIALLHARVDVANAWVALLQEQPDAAKAVLSNTNSTLERAVNLVAPDQRDLVRGMQQRLQLAQSGIDSDVNAALSDLSVLATNLLQLENDILTNR